MWLDTACTGLFLRMNYINFDPYIAYVLVLGHFGRLLVTYRAVSMWKVIPTSIRYWSLLSKVKLFSIQRSYIIIIFVYRLSHLCPLSGVGFAKAPRAVQPALSTTTGPSVYVALPNLALPIFRTVHCESWHCQTTERGIANFQYVVLLSLAQPNCHTAHCQIWRC
jgi:hypothetical protein